MGSYRGMLGERKICVAMISVVRGLSPEVIVRRRRLVVRSSEAETRMLMAVLRRQDGR